jgi:hypothetical protein
MESTRGVREYGTDELLVRALADRLDAQGCAYGRITHSLLERTAQDYARLEAKINALLVGIVVSPFAAALLDRLLPR